MAAFPLLRGSDEGPYAVENHGSNGGSGGSQGIPIDDAICAAYKKAGKRECVGISEITNINN